MNASPLVLITGPIGRTGEYALAAERAGWRAQPYELLEIRERAIDLSQLPKTIDGICVTSKHALPALRQLAERYSQTPVACVGEHTAQQVADAGFHRLRPAAATASELGAELARAWPAGAQLLWLRGSLSDDLAVSLRRAGFRVHDPIVYETLPSTTGGPPDFGELACIFFASPSAVRALSNLSANRDDLQTIDALAIGPTTARALQSSRLSFRSLLTLNAPTPAEVTLQLQHIKSAL